MPVVIFGIRMRSTLHFIIKDTVHNRRYISYFFETCFEKFLFVSIVWFVCSLARSFENFSKNSSRRRDRFGPKIVQFRAILAIFRPFEDFWFFGLWFIIKDMDPCIHGSVDLLLELLLELLLVLLLLLLYKRAFVQYNK